MFRHTEKHFGFTLDPAPNDTNVNRLIQIQLLALTADGGERAFGPRWPAGQIDDLIHLLQHVKKVLDSGCQKTPEGYWPRKALF